MNDMKSVLMMILWPDDFDDPFHKCPRVLSCPWNKSSVISRCLGCVSHYIDFEDFADQASESPPSHEFHCCC